MSTVESVTPVTTKITNPDQAAQFRYVYNEDDIEGGVISCEVKEENQKIKLLEKTINELMPADRQAVSTNPKVKEGDVTSDYGTVFFMPKDMKKCLWEVKTTGLTRWEKTVYYLTGKAPARSHKTALWITKTYNMTTWQKVKFYFTKWDKK